MFEIVAGELRAKLLGGDGAWPGIETTRRATHQRPGPTGVEGAEGTCRGAGGRWRGGGVWVFRTVCFERVVLSSPGCLWPGRMDDHEEVLEAHA